MKRGLWESWLESIQFDPLQHATTALIAGSVCLFLGAAIMQAALS